MNTKIHKYHLLFFLALFLSFSSNFNFLPFPEKDTKLFSIKPFLSLFSLGLYSFFKSIFSSFCSCFLLNFLPSILTPPLYFMTRKI